MKKLFVLTSLLLAAFTAQAADSPMMAHNAWARPTVEGQQGGGGFVTLMNHGKSDDKLISAASPAAARVELHSMSMEGNVMKMRKLESIPVKAGEMVELKPGGLHVMFMDIKKPLEKGSKVPVTFVFEKAGKLEVQFEVKPRASDDSKDAKNHEHAHKH